MEQWFDAVIPPAIALVLTGVGAGVTRWWQSRDRNRAATRYLAHAAQEVSFVEQWHAAATKIAPDDRDGAAANLAWSRLRSAFDLADEAGREARRRRPEPRTPRESITWALLTGRRTWQGWAAVPLYWLVLVWAAIWTGVGSSQTARDGLSAENVVIAALMIVVVGWLPVWLIRIFVIGIDQRYFGRREVRRRAVSND